MADMKDLLLIDRLPAMSASMVRAIPLLMDARTDWDMLESIIRRDEALTAAVLRLANSAKFGAPGKHFDLRRAMTRLGRDALTRCILEQQTAIIGGGENAAFGLQRGAMWRSAMGGAIAAEELAKRHRPEEASLAFLCGLLRDIGKLGLNMAFGGRYLAKVSEHASDGRSFVEAEHEALGFDHAQLGAAMARQWRLPERISDAIEKHHAPPPPGPRHDPLFDLVHAADTICRWAGLGVGVDGMEYRFADHVRAALNLDRKSAEREMALVWEKLRDAEESMSDAGKQGAAA